MIKVEYPWPYYTNREPECFDDIKMFALSFDTKIFYFKNYDTGFSEVVIKLFGFGLRISNKELS